MALDEPASWCTVIERERGFYSHCEVEKHWQEDGDPPASQTNWGPDHIGLDLAIKLCML